MARGKVGRKPKKKTTGPSSIDVVKTRSLDPVLGVSELLMNNTEVDKDANTKAKLQSVIEENVSSWEKAMNRSGQDVALGMNSNIPILQSSNIQKDLDVGFDVEDRRSKKIVKITQSDIAEEVNYWLPSIVGYVVGLIPL